VRINPMLFAMEGNSKSVPPPELVREQLEEAVTKLQAALPSATVIGGPGALKGVLGIIEETRAGIARKQQFLLCVAPSLAAPVGRKDVQRRIDEVLAAADECGVSSRTLVVLAALSSVLVPMGRSPAKKLLKLKAEYCPEDGYNALVDLRSLELLIHFFAFFPNQPTMLCTGDKKLALFWTGLGASNFKCAGAGISFDLSLAKELFGDFDAESLGAF
jgi:hypothetical protein